MWSVALVLSTRMYVNTRIRVARKKVQPKQQRFGKMKYVYEREREKDTDESNEDMKNNREREKTKRER